MVIDKKKILFRVAKAVTLYVVYLFTMFMVSLMITSWSDDINIRDFWKTDAMYSVAVYIYSFVVLFSLISIFVLHDSDYRERFLLEEEKIPRFSKRFGFIFRSVELWIDISVVCLMIFLLPSLPYSEMRIGFLSGLSEQWHFPIFLGVSFFSVALFSIMAYNSTLTWWARPKEKHKARLKKKDIIDLIKQVVISVLLYCAGAFVLPVVVPAIWSFGVVVIWLILSFTLVSLLAIAGFMSVKYLRAFYHRRRLLKKIKQPMADGGYTLVRTSNIYRSVLSADEGANIVIERDGQKYSCKFVTPLRKRETVLFDERGKVILVRKLIVAEHYKSENYFFDADEGTKKIIIVNPGARKIYATDDLHNVELQSGDKVMGYYIYRTDNFINAIERRYL